MYPNFIRFIAFRSYACGDLESQVRMALHELTCCGFVRYVSQGYRTLGPFAKLALARSPRQFNIAWDKIFELQNPSTISLSASSSHV